MAELSGAVAGELVRPDSIAGMLPFPGINPSGGEAALAPNTSDSLGAAIGSEIALPPDFGGLVGAFAVRGGSAEVDLALSRKTSSNLTSSADFTLGFFREDGSRPLKMSLNLGAAS
jgi:hypothetical protein